MVGERETREWLERRKKFKFLEKNFRTRWGEIDLIMEDRNDVVVFVEVKSRIENEFGSPLEQIDTKKISHLKKAIDIYLNLKSWQERACRLDAVGIDFKLDKNNDYQVTNVEYVEDLTGW